MGVWWFERCLLLLYVKCFIKLHQKAHSLFLSLSSSQGKRLQPKTQECKWYFWITVGSFVCVLNVCLGGNCYYGAVFVFVLWLSLSFLSALLCEVIRALYFLCSVVFSTKYFNVIYSSWLQSKFYILAPHTAGSVSFTFHHFSIFLQNKSHSCPITSR